MSRTPPRLPAVAHVMERYLGATETFVHDTLTAFRRIRPVVIAAALENLDRFPPPAAGTLYRSPPRRGTASWAVSSLRRRLAGDGAQPHLERILEREGARLIHAHFGPAGCGLLDVRRRTGLPLVTSFYGYDASMTRVVEEFRDRYRRLFDIGDAFLAEGSAMKRRLEELGCPSSKLRIQRIGIDPSRYRFRAREAPAGSPVVLLQCGRMVAKKGHDVTLRALAEARRGLPEVRLRILGDGPGSASIESLVRDLGVQDIVTLLGSRPRQVFLEEMDRAHILVQPSRTAPDGDAEGGAPTVLLEAQAAGLPILSTRHADIPEIVRENDSALLSDEGDVAGLAASMTRLVTTPALWGPMGRAGRAHVEENHDVGRLASGLEILYATLASTRRLDPVPQAG